ncbi:hypothetical protein UlMin_016283 [Ulmus minor]
MTRILVQRGSSSSSSSNPNRSSSLSGPVLARAEPQVNTPQVSPVKDEENAEDVPEQVVVDELPEYSGSSNSKAVKGDNESSQTDQNETSNDEVSHGEKVGNDDIAGSGAAESEESGGNSSQDVSGSSQPPPPPVPPPKPFTANSNLSRFVSGSSTATRTVPSRRAVAWPVVSTRTSPTGSRPSSPRSHGENEGYNSADEQNPCFVSSYDDIEKERQFEIDIRRAKGLEVKKMLEDGNCLFRAVADQVYGDSESYDLIRQMCIDYMEASWLLLLLHLAFLSSPLPTSGVVPFPNHHMHNHPHKLGARVKKERGQNTISKSINKHLAKHVWKIVRSWVIQSPPSKNSTTQYIPSSIIDMLAFVQHNNNNSAGKYKISQDSYQTYCTLISENICYML